MRLPWQKRQVKNNPAHTVINRTNYEPVRWTPRDYADLSKAGYENCMVAFACTKLIADTAAAIEFQLTDKKSGKEIEQHPMLDMLNNPSKYESKRTLITKIVSHLLLTGNAYGLQIPVLGKPRNLYVLRPDRMKVLRGSGYDLVGGYRYEIDGVKQDFKRDDVGHLRLFHPTDDFYGLGVIQAASRGIDIANLLDEWNATIFTNQLRPSGMLSLKFNPTPAQKEFLKTAWHEEYAGPENVGKTIVIEGDAEYTQLSMTQKEMDWLAGDKINAGKICSAFNIAPELIGAGTEKKYSNYGEARRALYTDNVLPMMAFITDELGRWLMPMFGLSGAVLKVDTEQIEALQEDRQAKFTYLQPCDWLTVNEKRRACGYDEIGPEGDVVLVAMGKIPLEQAVAEPEPVPDALQSFQDGSQGDDPDKPDTLPEEDADNAKARRGRAKKTHFWDAPEKKLRLWMAFDLRVKARERTFEHLAKEYLRRQADSIKSKIDAIETVVGLAASDLLDKKKEVKRYEEVFGGWYMDHYVRAHAAGMSATKGELFDDADFKADNKPTSWVNSMTSEQRAKLKRAIHDSGTKVNETAIDKIEDLIDQANEKNWTVNELASRISDNVSDWDKWRAQLWARTESAKVDNMGQLEGYRDIEFVTEKVWICAQVPDSRDWHIEADGQTVKLDDAFRVGDEDVQFPGDGSAKNTCNCLCSMAPVVGA